ncbi:MAG TPA: immunoglobulin domain-containing protein [Bacteroidota bacterium]|nr:immunoglobulin domain-containing protein [Bacteroidota bacterium]
MSLRLPARILLFASGIVTLLVLLGNGMSGQVVYKQPPPGSIYREYYQTMGGLSDWRVTDPNIDLGRWPDAKPFVPNPILHLTVDDLSGAVRAEAVFTMWGGHLGTFGKKVRFNGPSHSWIDIQPLDQSNGIPSGHDGTMYMSEPMEGVDVPLTDLQVGDNTFEGTNTGQIMNPSTGWGQFGWFAVILRVYYGPDKSHPTGTISSPSAGSSFEENPTIIANVSSGVDRVDFLAYYDGYCTDGDGIYQEYHSDYHIHQDEGSVVMRNHVGTATSAPFQTTWNTQWIPDQASGGIKLIARIRDNSGMWFVTDEVTGLTLSRPNSSVKLYKAANVPEDYWVKQYQESASNTFTIPAGDDLSKATDAIFIVRSWNGANGGATSPADHFSLRVNAWTAPTFGNDHYYSFDVFSLSPSELLSGTNQVTAFCDSYVHGVEICWPGPAVMVRYGAAASNQAPSITQQPSDQTVGVGETATFSVSATGSPAPTFQWQKNNVDITVNGNSATYTTPAVTKADSGAGYRCVVSNSQGNATSNTAILHVSTVAPAVTGQPTNQVVGVGETATFTITATGSTPLQYQWQRNGSNILSNGNAASYTTPAAVKADSGAAFRCVVSNTAGADTSHVAYLLVGSFAPSITTQPVSRTVQIGRTATFSVVATGTPPLTYTWLKNGAAIGGADSASYTTPPASLTDSGSVFRCIVSNSAGHDTSAAAILTVSNEVTSLVLNGGFESGTDHWGFFTNGIGSLAADVAGPTSAHAAHITITQSGSNVQLNQQSIVLTRDTMYTLRFRAYSSTGDDLQVSIFQDVSPYTNYGLPAETVDLTTSWTDFSQQFKATNFTGTETDGRLMFWLANNVSSAGDEYFIDDVVLLPSSLMVVPSITTQPAPQSVQEGHSATFTVEATSLTPLSYQWQKNQVDIAGANQASYTTPFTSGSDNGTSYRCVVSNLAGSTVSNAVTLTVTPAGGVKSQDQGIPSQYFLAQNYPNPFNPSTVIRFGLPTSGYVTLKVVNLLGQDVATLVSDFMSAGVHVITFAPDNMPTGMYLYRLQAGTYTETRKLVLIR